MFCLSFKTVAKVAIKIETAKFYLGIKYLLTISPLASQKVFEQTRGFIDNRFAVKTWLYFAVKLVTLFVPVAVLPR